MDKQGPIERPVLSAEKARGGEIILRKGWQRAGAVVLALVLSLPR
jgi:hypothetical protein